MILLLEASVRVVQEKWPNIYGEIYRIFIGRKIYVVISSPELVEVISSNSLIVPNCKYFTCHNRTCLAIQNWWTKEKFTIGFVIGSATDCLPAQVQHALVLD